MCILARVPMEPRGLRYPRTRVVGSYKPPDVGSGNQNWF